MSRSAQTSLDPQRDRGNRRDTFGRVPTVLHAVGFTTFLEHGAGILGTTNGLKMKGAKGAHGAASASSSSSSSSSSGGGRISTGTGTKLSFN